MTANGGDAVVEVRLVGFPLAVYRRAREHHDELMREFALLALDDDEASPAVPRRLVQLIEALRSRYGRITSGPDARRDEALARGDATMELAYRVPPEARQAALDLARMLDEADEFCRRGEHLLTLASPPDAVAFRRWYLGEFIAQIDGDAPTPWPAPSSPDAAPSDR